MAGHPIFLIKIRSFLVFEGRSHGDCPGSPLRCACVFPFFVLFQFFVLPNPHHWLSLAQLQVIFTFNKSVGGIMQYIMLLQSFILKQLVQSLKLWCIRFWLSSLSDYACMDISYWQLKHKILQWGVHGHIVWLLILKGTMKFGFTYDGWPVCCIHIYTHTYFGVKGIYNQHHIIPFDLICHNYKLQNHWSCYSNCTETCQQPITMLIVSASNSSPLAT